VAHAAACGAESRAPFGAAGAPWSAAGGPLIDRESRDLASRQTNRGGAEQRRRGIVHREAAERVGGAIVQEPLFGGTSDAESF
jgi:hypothetical protein